MLEVGDRVIIIIIRNDWNCNNETSFTSSKARPTASTI